MGPARLRQLGQSGTRPESAACLATTTTSCAFERVTKDGVSPAHCPRDIAGQVVEAAVELGFRPCTGIIHVPILLDGIVVTASGYYAATGYFIDAPSLESIPVNPTKADAKRALDRLLRPFRGYIDAGTVDRGALAAAALTAVLRPSLSTAPAIFGRRGRGSDIPIQPAG